MKRKKADSLVESPHSHIRTPRKQRTGDDNSKDGNTRNGSSAKLPSRQRPASDSKPKPTVFSESPVQAELETPTRITRSKLLATPTRAATTDRATAGTPSRLRNADYSARRKSARVLLDPEEDDLWDGGEKLAQEIWEVEEGNEDTEDPEDAEDIEEANGLAEAHDGARETAEGSGQVGETPKRRGRPKGSKTKRSPTPEGDLPPHEKYFFQNRPGPVQTSSNTLSKLTLLTHEEYFDQVKKFTDPHRDEKAFLLELHRRSFPQWQFELSESFNILLYGYGSKRQIVHQFAEWLHHRCKSPPTIIMVNGYAANITLRSVFVTIIGAILGPDTPSKFGTQPAEVLDFLSTILTTTRLPRPIMVFVNSIDAPSLRRPSNQCLLARLASLPLINMLATADTLNFLLLWDEYLRYQFNFVFHNCTTFATYEVETNVVDDVHHLLGRRARRIGGKEGVGFVLKSLPENTRKLYRLLITEILTLLGDRNLSENEDEGESAERRENGQNAPKDAVIEWRTLYHKAAEEFISSSEMMFRTQLKEFYDHQMIVSRTDSSGVEMLGLPLSRAEMEGVLEDLVIE